MKRGMSFWDILAWIVLGLILLWLILKMLGIINTPTLIEYAPYIGTIYLAGWAMSKFDTVMNDINGIKRNLSFLNRKVNDMDKDIGIIKVKCK